MMKLAVRDSGFIRVGRRVAPIAAVAIILSVLLFSAWQASAYVDGISLSGVSADCTQVTIVVNEAGTMSTDAARHGQFVFTGTVAIPSINVACPGNCDGRTIATHWI